MKKTAFLFPGQGSQSIGMGLDFYENFASAREIFEMSAEIAKTHISRLCFEGPMEDLTRTVNLQPAITAVNLAALDAIAGANISCAFSAGHSLGEYAALAAAGAITRADTVRLVCERGRLMHRESTRHAGAMHAIIGLDIETVDRLVAEVRPHGVVSVANHNTELQIVITGSPGPVEKVAALAREKGARAVPLKVSGAWHSELIRGAETEFGEALEQAVFSAPRHAVIHNVTADTLADPAQIRAMMGRQLTSPVRWYDTICRLMTEQVEIFVEIGPGKVLTGLLKKILPENYDAGIYTVNSVKTLDAFLADMG